MKYNKPSNNNSLEEHFNNDPLKGFYNLNGLENVILTCDIDWAPEYAIEKVLNTINSFGFKINVFSTHESALLKEDNDFVSVGIHPNFTRLKNSVEFEDEVKRLKEMYPESIGTRSHRNFFGQNIADIVNKYGCIYDASVFLWNQSFCQAHMDYNGMIRFTYCWEDGIHLDTNTPLELKYVNMKSPGLKIFNIHPVLFYLNTVTDDQRREVTSQYSDLTKAPKTGVDPYINQSFGIADFYIQILDHLKNSGVHTHFLDDLALEYLKKTEIKSIPQETVLT